MNLDRLVAPRSLAIVGATDRAGSYAHTTILNLQRNGFAGSVVGVHPSRVEAAGIPCVPHLMEVGPVDAVVIATPAETVPAYISQARDLGCGGAVVYSAGFAEAGNYVLQERLRSAAQDMPVIGPNGNGLVCVPSRAALWGDAVTLPADTGSIAVISESGNLGVIALAHRGGQGIHSVVSVGNSAVVDSATLLAHYATAPGVEVVALYLEGDGDGARWAQSLSLCAERDVRVVVLKAGRSARGAAAGASHTAALVGDQAILRALFDEAGAVFVRQPGELLETARALAGHRRDSRGAAVLTCSGGDAAIAADLAADEGALLATLSPGTEERLRLLLPSMATVANPLDHTALVWNDTEAVAALAETMARDAGVGHLLYVQDEPPGLPVGPREEWRATREGGVVGGSRADVDTMLVATTPGQEPQGAVSGLDNAFRALAALQRAAPSSVRLSDIASCMGKIASRTGQQPGHVSPLTDGIALSDGEAWAMLSNAGIPVPPFAWANDADEAVQVAGRLGFPVAVKGSALGLAHKTEMRAVSLALSDDVSVHREAQRIAAMDGIERLLVAQMAMPGLEFMVSATNRGVVPALVIAAGGQGVEALGDSVVVPLPASAELIRERLVGLRSAKALLWPRDGVARDIDGLCALAAAVGRLLVDEGLSLIELNPVMVSTTQSVAVDVVAARRLRS